MVTAVVFCFQGGTGAGDALSVYIVICMLEAKKYGVEVSRHVLHQASTVLVTAC